MGRKLCSLPLMGEKTLIPPPSMGEDQGVTRYFTNFPPRILSTPFLFAATLCPGISNVQNE